MKKNLFLLVFQICCLITNAQTLENDSISIVVNQLKKSIWKKSSHFIEVNDQIDSSEIITGSLDNLKYIDWEKHDDGTWVFTRFYFKQKGNTLIVSNHGSDRLRVKFVDKKVVMYSAYSELYEYRDEIIYIDDYNLIIRQINPDQIEVISFIKEN